MKLKQNQQSRKWSCRLVLKAWLLKIFGNWLQIGILSFTSCHSSGARLHHFSWWYCPKKWQSYWSFPDGVEILNPKCWQYKFCQQSGVGTGEINDLILRKSFILCHEFGIARFTSTANFKIIITRAKQQPSWGKLGCQVANGRFRRALTISCGSSISFLAIKEDRSQFEK